MAIDFRFTARQRELQLQSRKFAREVLARALEAETLPTPEERFAATRTAYEAIDCGGISAEMHSSFRWGRERWSHRHCDHGRGALSLDMYG